MLLLRLSDAFGGSGMNGADHAINGREMRNEEGDARIAHHRRCESLLSVKSCNQSVSYPKEGLNGETLQNGKVNLPRLKTSEARETKEVCRALQEDDEWTPRVEKALWALSPKLQTTILARILKRQSNPSLAWKVFQWAESLPGFEHDSSTFSALVEALGKAEDLEALWTLINDMRVADVKVKPIPFTFLISSYGRSGKIKEAELTLHSMQDAGMWLSAR